MATFQTRFLTAIGICLLLMTLSATSLWVIAQEPPSQPLVRQRPEILSSLSIASECSNGQHTISFGEHATDAQSDVLIPHADITGIDSSLTVLQELSILFHLRDAPAQLPHNREGVPANLLEYAWEAFIDIDNDPTTGSSSGTEYSLSITSWVFEDEVGDTYTDTIYNISQQNTWIYSDTTGAWHYLEDAFMQVEPTSNTIRIDGRIPGLTENSKIYLNTYDYNPGGELVIDELNCAYTPESIVIEPTGGTFVSEDEATSIIFPAGAVTASTTITFTTQDPSLTGALYGINRFFRLDATDIEGNPVTSFAEPVTVVTHYTDEDLGTVAEDSLDLYWLDDTTWTQDGISTIERGDHVITSTVSHFTTFALLGTESAPTGVFMPLIKK